MPPKCDDKAVRPIIGHCTKYRITTGRGDESTWSVTSSVSSLTSGLRDILHATVTRPDSQRCSKRRSPDCVYTEYGAGGKKNVLLVHIVLLYSIAKKNEKEKKKEGGKGSHIVSGNKTTAVV